MAHHDAITARRLLAADPATVWAHLTEPERLAAWFNPAPGLDAEVQAFEPTPGGALQVRHRGPGGSDYARRGTVQEVEPPHLLRWREPLGDDTTSTTIALAPADDGTEVTVTQDGLPAAYRKAGREGWDAMLAKLAERAVEKVA